MTSVAEADAYLGQRTGCFEYRAVRYNAAVDAMIDMGLRNSDTVYDIGAGMTEFDVVLRERSFRGRYIPIDAGIDGTDLNNWVPPRHAEFAVALELLEHLDNWCLLVTRLQMNVDHIVVSVPNPRTVDVLGIDETHVSIITQENLEFWGFEVQEAQFYGGVFSDGRPDSLFATWSYKGRK